MTYLEIINKVLRKLRESTVSTSTQTTYSLLIGEFINETKREIEDSWRWSALRSTITVTTAASTQQYTLTGSGTRFQTINVWNNTNYVFLERAHIDEATLIANSGVTGQPMRFTYYQTDTSTGDAKVLLTPVPDGIYSIIFTMYIPQAVLSADADVITIPWEPVVLGAYAKAIEERGEEGGISFSAAYGYYQKALADAIQLEGDRNAEELIWIAN